jgi:hypothetical protein
MLAQTRCARPSPGNYSSPGSSFSPDSPLQSSFAPHFRTTPFGMALTALGFRPSSRHHCGASTCARASRASLRSVLRRSQPLDGLLRAATHELVSSRNRVQGSLSFRGFFLSAAVLPRRKDPAPLPLAPQRSPSSHAFARGPDVHTTGRRLRGFDPHEDAFRQGQ